MNNEQKKMYVAPSILEHVIELEQGIAAASVGNAQPGAPGVSDYEEGQGGSGWDTNNF
jgi:hypothetical protein